MKYLTKTPYKIKEVKNVFIRLKDNTRIAARIWMPENAEKDPVPAILEYIPYRKNDSTALRDSMLHPYFAGNGYVAIRVDIRGSGDSDGILHDEYTSQEQDDAIEIIEWISKQKWCNGKVGMFGISWGGFNGLQVAAKQPKQLKTVISLCSSDDRYADDVHYMGGCVLGIEMLPWASTMLAYNSRPPDPKYVGDRWKKIWLERLNETPAFIETWLTHQRRDEYWQHGSICEDYSKIKCPVFLVGGWADGYTNTIPRMLENLSCPRKGLIGPWAHMFPHCGSPGPLIGFLQECLAWYDKYLKGFKKEDNVDPILTAWMQESLDITKPYKQDRSGRWVTEMKLPSKNIIEKKYYMGDRTLDNKQRVKKKIEHKGELHSNINAGMWCSGGDECESPKDQREEDERSLTFTSSPLKKETEILGFPEIDLKLSSDQPNSLIVVRLCDVSPSGSSLLVSYGLLNLTHYKSDKDPELLKPGKKYNIKIKLNYIAHSLKKGHRWRVSVSSAYFPHAWPSPKEATITVFTCEKSFLTLPVRLSKQKSNVKFKLPECTKSMEYETLREGEHNRTLQYDQAKKEYKIIDIMDRGSRKIKRDGIVYDATNEDVYSIKKGDPLSAKVTCKRTIKISRDKWDTKIEIGSSMISDKKAFYVTNSINAYQGEKKIFTKFKKIKIDRYLV